MLLPDTRENHELRTDVFYNKLLELAIGGGGGGGISDVFVGTTNMIFFGFGELKLFSRYKVKYLLKDGGMDGGGGGGGGA